MWAAARMSQRPDRLRFACESREPIRIVRERVGQNLPREVAIQLAVAGAVDLSHASRADEREDFVGAEASAGRERHKGECRGLTTAWPRLYGGFGPGGGDCVDPPPAVLRGLFQTSRGRLPVSRCYFVGTRRFSSSNQ